MPRILVIEDDDAQRETYKEILKFAGYDVLDAPDGKNGLDIYRARPCDVVVTDIYMPQQDGLETILLLKEEFPGVKIIAISGGGLRSWKSGRRGFELALMSASEFGAEYVLRKPFTREQLLNIVAAATQRS